MAESRWKHLQGDVRPGRERLRRDVRGVVYIEFIIAFIPMFIFFLGMIQLAFMYSGKMVVAAAARKAVRTAIVHIDNEETCLSGGNTTQKNPFHKASGMGSPPQMSGNEIMDKVRTAAYLPLSVLAPRISSYPFVGGVLGIAEGLGDQTARMLGGYFLYSRGAAAVTFRTQAGEVIEPGDIRRQLQGDTQVKVRVSYVFPCIVPIARRIMCNPLYDMVGLSKAARRAVDRLKDDVRSIRDPMQLIEDPRDYWDDIGSVVQGAENTVRGVRGVADGVRRTVDGARESANDLKDRVQDAKAVYKEMGRAEYPALMAPWAFSSIRFAIFDAEAQLPNQWATYSQERLKKGCGGGNG